MYDKTLVSETITEIEEVLLTICRRTKNINKADDFMLSEEGMILLDSVCIKLMAIGESIKSIDKITHKELFLKYPEIKWRNVMGMRDIIVHHYFDIDVEEIYKTLKQDIPPLMSTLTKIKRDLEYNNR